MALIVGNPRAVVDAMMRAGREDVPRKSGGRKEI
jgi:hypothetical protein